jgi:pimeloyl-ACP methyl ester carboxylesterase
VLHDFGGPWGLQWAADHPDAHASTTLINTGVLLREKWHALAKVWRTPGLGELFFATSSRRGSRAFMKRTNPPTFPLAFADEVFDMYADKGTRRAVLKLYRATDIEPHVEAIAPRLREHPRPTLVVWGAKDPYLKVRLAERQREVFRDATVIELPASGHWPLADAPAAVVDVVLPFLREQIRNSPAAV